MGNKIEKVSLYGIRYYNECGYIMEHLELLATFDNQTLADDYVVDSTDDILPDYQENPVVSFKKGTLLEEFEYYRIEKYDFPHNPKVGE